MLRSKAFYKKTRRGKVFRIVEDHYLRDDIGCGHLAGNSLTQEMFKELVADSERKDVLVLDANVALNQIDLLEHPCPAFSLVVILQTVFEEVRHNNLALARRLRQLMLGESRPFVFFANEHHCQACQHLRLGLSPNDRNDRAIRVATAWFAEQVGGAGRVLLLTNDRLNREAAGKEGLAAHTVQAYVKKELAPRYPELEDLLARPEEEEGGGGGGGGGRRRRRQALYPAHLPMSELARGVQSGKYFQGPIRCERGGWQRGYVVEKEKEAESRMAVHIVGWEHMNRAVNGDIVAIEVLPRDQWLGAAEARDAAALDARSKEEGEKESAAEGAAAEVAADTAEETPPGRRGRGRAGRGAAAGAAAAAAPTPTGRVVGVVKRNWRPYCGSVEAAGDRLGGGGGEEGGSGGSTSVLFRPVERTVPKVRLVTRQRAALAGKRILVALDAWPADSRYPHGHYVRTLGDAGDKEVETQVVLLEHDIPFEPFSDEVLACLPDPDNWLTEDEVAKRRDLRHIPVMSIDPPGCKDIDDALHCIQLDNGNWQAGVHIADVTHFVAAGSALDLEAANRSTSTYLVERRLDMLPGLLTETLCSLKGEVDRYAFSVLWEVTPEGDIVDVEFCKSVIHSIAATSYDEAQMMLDDPNRDDIKAQSVRRLNKLAKIFRARRIAAGALTLASPEVRFQLDSESRNPTDVQMYQLKETNALVEEFMLLANITVAKRVLRTFPTLCCLRRHPAPSRQQFAPLLAAVASVGMELDIATSKTLADSLDAAARPGDPYFNKLLRVLSTRCMSPAQYFCSGERTAPEWHHYGLAAPVYTHFTSPIRRYADVVVHRLLAAALGVAPLPAALATKAHTAPRPLHELTENMNRRHRAAQMAGRASVQLHTLVYFKDRPQRQKAYILGVRPDGVSVLVPRFGIEGTLKLDAAAAAAGGRLACDEEAHALTFTP
ncbi:unnamed protein product, partial [Heterosigma akashiwo]